MVDMPSQVDIANLVAEHHRAVYQYAFRLTGSVPDAEDLTQHVFLAAHRNIAKLRNIGSVRGWLYTILRNRFLKEKQRRWPLPAADLQFDMDAVPDIPPAETIDQERLQEALNQLPDASRVVLVMFYFEESSYREIAEQLRLPIGTVMSRLARAKARLRAVLFRAEQGARVQASTGNLASISK
jgi:RNA polymerase sigma-70 factor (ECF subfamily)